MKKLLIMLNILYNYLIVHRGDKIAYLRAMGVKIGDNCEILNSIMNFSSEPYLIEIGNDVTLTAHVKLITHDASSRIFRKTLNIGNSVYGNLFGRIIIGNNCFIGINTVILPNVTIGDDSIIGACSVVTKNVPSRTVFAGNPAKQICTVDQFISKYCRKMIPCQSIDRASLRQELTEYFWNEYR